MMGPLRIAVFLGCALFAQALRPLVEQLQPVLNDQKEFDYFLLVRQWPGNYCSKHACPLLHDHSFHFTIHGLWPNYDDGTWPQFCETDYKFDVEEVEDIEGAMEEEWPSFMGEDETFWEHEWSKHGTCALNVLRSEHKFFKTVLKLHWKYDLAAALRADDILPRSGAKYRNSEVAGATARRYGVTPIVHCYDGALSEVWMCFDKDLQPVSCKPPSHDSAACSEFTIPPLKSAAVAATEGAAAASEHSHLAAARGSGVHTARARSSEEDALAEAAAHVTTHTDLTDAVYAEEAAAKEVGAGLA